jgi:SpoVK/Ycf46/Vps4 family AAA+-type ATPase
VSKYIGETEKNLARVFDDAARRGAVLFFDEADALFGKRSEVRDAHDRYANVEVGFLPQKVEEFDGVVILATNLPRNIDDAFLRRMRMAVEFPFPDEAARLRIWQAHLPPELPRDDDVDLAALARECKVAGGVISKIVWNAACLAADEGDRLRMAHLRHAVRREYQRLGKPVQVA